MLSTEGLKRFLAIVALVCVFLPIGQCSRKADTTSHTPQVSQSGETPAGWGLDVFVAADYLKPGDAFEKTFAAGLLALFGWPFMAIILRKLIRVKTARIAANLAELVCCVITLYWLGQILRIWNEILYGGVIALGCFITYGLLAVWDLWKSLKNEALPLTGSGS